MAENQDHDPIEQFQRWLAEAHEREPNDPTAMTLATADADGIPSARMVLLKDADSSGFVFYTNAESRKGLELDATARASLVFHWKSLRRQVRVDGPVEPVTEDQADAYFASRTRGSQIGAWASDQSQPLASRALLENRAEEYEAKFPAGEVSRPPFWSGFRVVPERIEFWTERSDRLHDRQLFERLVDGGWRESWLYP